MVVDGSTCELKKDCISAWDRPYLRGQSRIEGMDQPFAGDSLA